MSYYVTITRCDLYYTNLVRLSLNQKDYHYPWYNEGIYIYIEDRAIKWSDEFITDLLHMIEESIQGKLTLRKEDEEYTTFWLTENKVLEFFGSATYPNEPITTHRKKEQ